MKEIEILFKVLESKESVLEKLDNFTPLGEKIVVDEYYYSSNNPKMYTKELSKNVDMENQITEWFRIRKTDEDTFITFKKDNFKEDGSWFYSDEYETKVTDLNIIKKIVASLGLKHLITVHNKKHIFVSCRYEIVLEEVKDLGLFLEVEFMNPENKDVDVNEERKKIFEFVNDLGIKLSEELNLGKPELLLVKKTEKNLENKK